MEIHEIRTRRTKALTDARSILDAAGASGRELTQEERNRYDAFMRDVNRDGDLINEHIRVLEAEAQESRWGQPQSQPIKPEIGGDEATRSQAEREARRAAWRRFLVSGKSALSEVEVRALSSTDDPSGGYLVAPEEFVNELVKFVDNLVFIRGLAHVDTVQNAQSLGYPSLDADPADADWTSELDTGSEDSTMAFGKRELHPHPLAKRLRVSNKLLRQTPSVETLVQERLAYKFAVTLEKAYMTGTGVQQPLGLFTASSLGISTGRDVSTGNTSSAIGADNLFEVKYGLKTQYWPRARWLFSRTALKQVHELKDSQNRYLLNPADALQSGAADSLLGLPVLLSEYVPATFTTGLYVGMLGDFSFYWIADALSMQVQRLVELYAATNQTGYIGRLETDGMPVLEEAFVRVKLG